MRSERRRILITLTLALTTSGLLGQRAHAQISENTADLDAVTARLHLDNTPEDRIRDLAVLKQVTPGKHGQLLNSLLPTATTPEEAQQLLDLAAANPITLDNEPAQDAADSEFLPDIAKLARSVKRGTAPLESLADIRIDRLDDSAQAHSHVLQVFRINTSAAARRFSPRNIVYSALLDALRVDRAQIWKADGRVVNGSISADQAVIERSTSMYYDSRSRGIRFNGVEAGDLVVVEYHLAPISSVNPWGRYYAHLDLFRDSTPTALRRRVLISPNGLALHSVEHGVRPATVRKGDLQTTRIWEARDLRATAFEPLSPGATVGEPYLHVSTIGSIEEFGRWYKQLLNPNLALSPELQALADQIRAYNPTTTEKIQAVYEYVQRHTKYIAFEFGVRSYQPYPVGLVAKRGFGDCKDKASLMVALLRAVGVEAEFAMMRTRSAGEVDPAALSVQLFNHAVVYVPALDLFLDGTADYASPGELPPDDQGAMAITLDRDGKASRAIVPFASADRNRVSRLVRAKLESNGRVEFDSDIRFSGYFAAEQRKAYEATDVAGSYRATLAQFYPSVTIAHAVAEGTARASRAVELKIQGSIEATRKGRTMTLRSSLTSNSFEQRFASDTSRKNSLLVPVTPSERETFEYELPEGATVNLPHDLQLQTAFGKVEVTYWQTGHRLVVETYTELVPLTIAPSDYPAFRAFCQAADQALQHELEIQLP